ncbi:MAG: YIP1 family protein [Verrucomicrobiota bacterium]
MENSRKPLNPWVSMWTKPRATMQQIIDENPDRLVILLAVVAGFSQALDQASVDNRGDHMEVPVIFIMSLVFGPVGGLIGLYLGGFLLSWTGNWIGGVASARFIRSAIAWSNVPIIWAMLLWIPELLLFGEELFTSATPSLEANPILATAMLGFGLIQVTVGVWTLVVFFKCLGQVQGFSAWKAVGNSLLAGLVIIIPVFVVAFAIGLVTG